jgi:hypothetical protein
MNAAGVGKLARQVEIAGGVDVSEIVGRVETFDRTPGNGREGGRALGGFFQRRLEGLALPALLRRLGDRFHLVFIIAIVDGDVRLKPDTTYPADRYLIVRGVRL